MKNAVFFLLFPLDFLKLFSHSLSSSLLIPCFVPFFFLSLLSLFLYSLVISLFLFLYSLSLSYFLHFLCFSHIFLFFISGSLFLLFLRSSLHLFLFVTLLPLVCDWVLCECLRYREEPQTQAHLTRQIILPLSSLIRNRRYNLTEQPAGS